ncbi:WhiB family transcriptional regulator [Kitasatospora sp. NPDC059722]|uniref:WhiB family transcriptional regulator n=1 Tax=Kitasatospora sp. NPDC059722 TaxID=3346925 RepID=UPI0036A18C03
MADAARLPASRLPEASEHHWSRGEDGACRTADRGIFDRPAQEHGAAAKDREEAAKAVCAGCEVRVECRRHALAAREPHGVWGGLAEEERRALFTSDSGPRAA